VPADGTDIMPPAMGQPINVVEKPSRTPGIARFEINRSLTGMGHERYASAEAILGNRAVDELARRLFATGGVTWVHVNSSVITVELVDGWAGEQLLDVIRGLYIFYPQAGEGPGSASAVSGRPGEEATSGDSSPTNGAEEAGGTGVGGDGGAGETAEPEAEPAAGAGAAESDTRQ
jgi:hypothetical protein